MSTKKSVFPIKKVILILLGVIILVLVFKAGMAWEKFQYEDICLDLGGGMNPGNFPICVVEK